MVAQRARRRRESECIPRWPHPIVLGESKAFAAGKIAKLMAVETFHKDSQPEEIHHQERRQDEQEQL